MGLKLILRHDEEHDEFHRRIIERVELDPGATSAEGGHHFLDSIGRGVRNGDAETDAGAHRFLALFERGENAFAILRLDLAQADQQIDQLDDGRPTFGRLHLGNDLLGR